MGSKKKDIATRPGASQVKKTDLSQPQMAVVQSQKPRTLYHSGQGGGKTFVIGVISYLNIRFCPKATGFIGANVYNQLSDSTLKEVFQVWKTFFGITEWSKTNPSGFFVQDKEPPPCFEDHGYTFKDNYNKIFFRNGGLIFTRSLEKYKNIEGINIAWAILDETSDTRQEAVKEVITARLRQKSLCLNTRVKENGIPFVPPGHPDAGDPINPLYVMTKPAKEQWLTEFFKLKELRDEIEAVIFKAGRFFLKDTDNRRIVIASTHWNKKHLTAGYISNRLKELTKDQAELLIWGSPFGKSGNEYYANYKRNKHVKPVAYDHKYPVHLGWDFNVNPYMSCLVAQIVPEDGRIKIRIITEIKGKPPRNTIEATCRLFLDEFEHLIEELFFYGDTTGKNTLPIETARSYFQIIESELQEFIRRRSRRLLTQNPRHKSVGKKTLGRRSFMNSILSGARGIDIEIDPSCTELIDDLDFLLEEVNGAKQKKKGKVNGIECELRGHMSDALDSIVCYLYGDYNKERI